MGDGSLTQWARRGRETDRMSRGLSASSPQVRSPWEPITGTGETYADLWPLGRRGHCPEPTAILVNHSVLHWGQLASPVDKRRAC